MIRFLGRGEDGNEVVAVVDWFHRKRARQNRKGDEHLEWHDVDKGELKFTFRPQRPDETIEMYFDRIQNEYYWRLGKNTYRYQDD